MSCPACHKPFIPDIPGYAPQAVTLLPPEYEDVFIVHQHCATDFQTALAKIKGAREKQRFIRNILKQVSAAIFVLFLFAIPAYAKDKGVRGCLATYHSQTGTFTYEPFVKVADKEALSEDGEPEVWGFKLWSLDPDPDGKVHAVNVKESIFIEARKAKKVGPRMTRCPPYF